MLVEVICPHCKHAHAQDRSFLSSNRTCPSCEESYKFSMDLIKPESIHEKIPDIMHREDVKVLKPDAVEIRCPECKHHFKMDRAFMGSKRECPGCSQQFLVSKEDLADRSLAERTVHGLTKTLTHAHALRKAHCPLCEDEIVVNEEFLGCKTACPACNERFVLLKEHLIEKKKKDADKKLPSTADIEIMELPEVERKTPMGLIVYGVVLITYSLLLKPLEVMSTGQYYGLILSVVGAFLAWQLMIGMRWVIWLFFVAGLAQLVQIIWIGGLNDWQQVIPSAWILALVTIPILVIGFKNWDDLR